MNQTFRQSISVLLAVLMVFTATPAFALAANGSAADQGKGQATTVQNAETAMTAQAVNPAKVNEAVTKFTDAMSKFVSDASKLDGLNTFLTRFGGVNAAASGVIGVLQMCGVIKDPTSVALGEILNTVKDIQTQLNQMDTKLDDINKQLVSIAVAQEEKDRSNKAASMLKYWQDFNTNYSEPLDKEIAQYQSKINAGIRNWWKSASHDGIRVLYTSRTEERESAIGTYDHYIYELTYAKGSYADGIPAEADNGETIASSNCIGVPAALLPDTASRTFDINKYRDTFEQEMAANIIKAADAAADTLKSTGKLPEDAGAGSRLDVNTWFYLDWMQLTDAQKQERAAQYAADVLNTQLYHIACDVMSDNDEWVTDVISDYKKYCDNVLAQNSGVNAMLNAMYLTHGFEGEIKDDINTFCDAMTAKAGMYGQFALTCAGQDDMQSEAGRLAVQERFANTVTSLGDRKAKALTGFDNYCYITGTRVKQSTVTAESWVYIKHTASAYKGCNSTGWKITVPSIVDDVYSQVLYHQYQSLDQGKKTFAAYLHAYGAFNSDNNGLLMTQYKGSTDFAFSEGIRMIADSCYAGEKYFKTGQYYNIDVGTGSKVEQKYYRVHDKVTCDRLDMNTGELQVNQLAGARALYGESHWNWSTDETWKFVTKGLPGWRWGTYGKSDGTDLRCDIDFTVLELEPIHDLNGDTEDPENPFFAYDQATLTEGVSDVIGPIVQDTKPSITAASLEGETFSYTGDPIKPYVTVRSGKKKVPMDSFDVSYEDCTDIGTASVTVTAKEGSGYTGTTHLHYQIMPAGTKISKAKRSKTSAALTWKAQTALMGDRNIQGYQIRYSTKKSMKGAKTVKAIGAGKTSTKIRGLKKNKKYYVQIRTYMTVDNHLCYSKWSGKKVVKKAGK